MAEEREQRKQSEKSRWKNLSKEAAAEEGTEVAPDWKKRLLESQVDDQAVQDD